MLNELTPKYAEIFGEKYSALYRQHIEGHKLAHDMSIEEYRANPVLLGFGGAPGPEIGQIRDINIPVTNPPGEIKARIYYPEDYKAEDPRPCYLNYHGGGWVIGAIGDDESFIRTVVKETGAIACDIDYRVAPEHRYPTPLDDSWDAFCYFREHGKQYVIDTSRMSVGGFSAGGHISAVISQRARDAGYNNLVFTLLVIPVTDATSIGTDLQVSSSTAHQSWREHHDGPFLSHARMSWFYKYFLPEKFNEDTLRQPKLSPLLTPSVKGLPAALVAVAEVDVLQSEGLAYGKKLAEEGDSWVQVHLFKGVPHPFPHQVEATDQAVKFRQIACQRLSEAFAGKLKNKDVISNA